MNSNWPLNAINGLARPDIFFIEKLSDYYFVFVLIQ